jgi:hypothetical protein
MIGVADASGFAAAVEELARLARRPGWVTEDPGVHLVPQLRGARIEGLRVDGCGADEHGVLTVTAEHRPGALDGCAHSRCRAQGIRRQLPSVLRPAASEDLPPPCASWRNVGTCRI